MKYFEDLIHYLQYQKRYSEHTIKAYHADLNHFSAFCQSNFQIEEPAKVTDKVIRNWMVELMEGKVSARSVNRKLSTLKTYFKFLMNLFSIHHPENYHSHK